jgi:hypothetical protein
VRIRGTCRVADAFGEWGTHNTLWRAGRHITDTFEGVDFVLTYYSALACRILDAEAFGCVRAEISAEDVPLLKLYNDVPAAEWAAAVFKGTNRSGDDVRAMAAAQEPVVGPLLCAGLLLQPPVAIFDGWHRTAAWIQQGGLGKAYPIAANIILTRNPVRLG